MSENKYQKAIRMITEDINFRNEVMKPRLLEDKHMHDFVVEKSHECLALLEELVEKSIPKEVNVWESNDYLSITIEYHYNCPVCEEYFGYETKEWKSEGNYDEIIGRVTKGMYCYSCGQRLDWEATVGKEQTSGKTDN